MLPATLPLLLLLVVVQESPVLESIAACDDSRRIDLTLTPTEKAREVCVSPGMMTGFLFDTPLASLELQEEVRFAEVLRGQRGLSFVPPKDMMRGERLRLTVRLETGAPQEVITFILVAHRGQATRQVEVYRDKRSRESYQEEAEAERAKNQRLRQENQQLRVQLERTQGLRSLVASKIVGGSGVQALFFQLEEETAPAGSVSCDRYITYRSDKTVVVEVWLLNYSTEPWMTIRASLTDASGKEMPGIQLLQKEAILAHGDNAILLELDATRKEAQGDLTLMLWDERSRVITLAGVRFP